VDFDVFLCGTKGTQKVGQRSGAGAAQWSGVIRDDVKLAYLVRAQTVCPEVAGSIPAKTAKIENSNPHLIT